MTGRYNALHTLAHGLWRLLDSVCLVLGLLALGPSAWVLSYSGCGVDAVDAQAHTTSAAVFLVAGALDLDLGCEIQFQLYERATSNRPLTLDALHLSHAARSLAVFEAGITCTPWVLDIVTPGNVVRSEPVGDGVG